MSISEKKRDLAFYRLQQAEESLDEAKYLFDGNRSSRSVINRAYYAMFYSVLALLIFEPYSSSKHSGVLSYFNRKFIRTGLLPEDLGRAVNKAFEVILERDQVAPFIEMARKFIDSVRNYLKNAGSI